MWYRQDTQRNIMEAEKKKFVNKIKSKFRRAVKKMSNKNVVNDSTNNPEN